MSFLKNKYWIFYFLILVLATDASATLFKFKGIVDVEKGSLYPFHFIEIKGERIVSLREKTLSTEKYEDFSNLYLSPGLIDAHAHIFVSQIISDGNFSNALIRERSLSKKERMSRAENYLHQYLAEGFTAIFDLGNSGKFLDIELRNTIRGNNAYPLMYVSGPGLAAFPGQFPQTATLGDVGKEYTVIDSKNDINKILDQYVQKKVDILKIYLDNFPGPGVIDETVLIKILNYPHLSKFKKVTFHSFIPASGALLRKYKIKNTEHFNFYMGEDFPKSLSFISPTNFDTETMKQFKQYTASYYLLQQNVLKRLYSEKFKILFGPDFYFDEPENPVFNRAKLVKRTLNSFIDAGFDPKEILKMMTYNPALSMGLEKQIGQISPGSFANMIGTKENPLAGSSALFNIPLVINRGKVLLNK
jgi:imidazolonepropionase-like amidohydrolase